MFYDQDKYDFLKHHKDSRLPGIDADGWCVKSVGKLVPEDFKFLVDLKPSIVKKNSRISNQIVDFFEIRNKIQQSCGPIHNQKFICHRSPPYYDAAWRQCFQFQSKSLKKLYVFLKAFDSTYRITKEDFGNDGRISFYVGRGHAKDGKAADAKKRKKKHLGKAYQAAELAFKHSENVLEALSMGGPIAAGVTAALLPLYLVGKGIHYRQKHYKYWVRIFPTAVGEYVSTKGMEGQGMMDCSSGSGMNTQLVAEALAYSFAEGDADRKAVVELYRGYNEKK